MWWCVNFLFKLNWLVNCKRDVSWFWFFVDNNLVFIIWWKSLNGFCIFFKVFWGNLRLNFILLRFFVVSWFEIDMRSFLNNRFWLEVIFLVLIFSLLNFWIFLCIGFVGKYNKNDILLNYESLFLL